MGQIQFFNEDLDFLPEHQPTLISWISSTVQAFNKELGDINFIFCSDDYLLSINQQYLNHDTLTDIVTFDYCENNTIEGEVFISVDRVQDNAQEFNARFEDELHRVMIHGILHLLGFSDKTEDEKMVMREKEDHFLNLYHN